MSKPNYADDASLPTIEVEARIRELENAAVRFEVVQDRSNKVLATVDSREAGERYLEDSDRLRDMFTFRELSPLSVNETAELRELRKLQSYYREQGPGRPFRLYALAAGTDAVEVQGTRYVIIKSVF